MKFYEQKESGPQLGILNDIIAEQAGVRSGPTRGSAARLKVDQAGPGGHAGLCFFFFSPLVETFSEDAKHA